MKTRFRSQRTLLAASASLRSFLLGSSVLAAATSLQAQNLYWDTNAGADGFGASPGGTWGASAFWNSNSAGTGTTANTTTTTSHTINFGTSTYGFSTSGVPAQVLFSTGTKSAGNITFGSANTAAVVINNGSDLSLAAASIITVNTTAGGSIAGKIVGAATSITKEGVGTLSLSGNASTYTGATIINGGTVQANQLAYASGASSLGNAGTAADKLVLNGGTLNKFGSLSGTTARLFTLGANGGGLSNVGTAENMVFNSTGSIVATGSENRTLTLGGTFSTGTGNSLAPVLADASGGGKVSVVKNGANTWIFSGATNSYSGGTTVNNGTLTMGSASALGNTSGQLTVNGGTLNMEGQNLTVGNLTGTGGVISGASGARVLTIGQGDFGGGNYQGQINNGGGGSTALTKTGSGTITLSGTNGYTGATSVNGGQLVVTGAISSSSGVTVKNLAILAGESSDAGATNGKVSAITLNGGDATRGILAPGNGTAGDKGTLYGNSLAWTGATSAGNSQMVFDLGAINTNDKLVLSGAMTKGSGSIFEWDFGGTALFGTTYTLVTAAGGFGTFADTDFSWKAGSLGAGLTVGTFSITGTSLTFTAIPEPSTALGGLLLTAGLLRRRRQAKA